MLHPPPPVEFLGFIACGWCGQSGMEGNSNMEIFLSCVSFPFEHDFTIGGGYYSGEIYYPPPLIRN